jgi:hypothetical protein
MLHPAQRYLEVENYEVVYAVSHEILWIICVHKYIVLFSLAMT